MTSVGKALEEYPPKCCVCGGPILGSEKVFGSEETCERCIICHQRFHFRTPPFRWGWQESFVVSGDDTRCGVRGSYLDFESEEGYFYFCAHCLHDKYGKSVEEFAHTSSTPSTQFDSLIRSILILALVLTLLVLLGCAGFLAFGYLARFIATVF